MVLSQIGEYSKERRASFAAGLTFVGVLVSALGGATQLLNVTDGRVTTAVEFISLIGVIALIAGLLLTIWFLPEDISKKVTAVIEEKDAELQASRLRKIVPKPEPLLKALRSPGGDPVASLAGNVLYNFIEEDAALYIEELEAYLGKQADPIELRHVNAVYSSLEAVVDALPDHSCWLGISHLTDPDAWNSQKNTFAPNKFERFQVNSLKKVAEKRLTILRVYVASQQDIPRLASRLEADEQAGLGVRVFEMPEGEDRGAVPDVSLLWVPPQERGTNIEHLDQIVTDPLSALEASKYAPLYALQFQAHNPTLLSTVKITSAARPPRNVNRHQTFDQLMGIFKDAWAESKAPDQLN